MRYPSLSFENMNAEQQRVVRAVTKRRKPSVSSEGGVEGPFVPLVYIPEILDRFQALGEHCRFHTSVPAKLRELAIIVTARYNVATMEFHVHAMEAREFGLPDATIDAIAEKKRPLNMEYDEALVHDFCVAFHSGGRIPKDLGQKLLAAFSQTMIVEIMATCGYYGTLALSMNVSHPPVPKFLAGFKPAFAEN
jgi:4-carboxymuconolactone decarboxylase